MRVMLWLGIAAGVGLCFIGTTAFKEAHMVQKRTALVREKTQYLKNEKEELSHFDEREPISLEAVYVAWVKEMSLLAAMRKVSLGVTVKEGKNTAEEALFPGIKRMHLGLSFSGLRHWSDLAGMLAGIDDLLRMPEHLPVVVEEVRQEKNGLFVEVSLFGTISGEKI